MEPEKSILLEAWRICSEGKHKNADQYQKAYEYIETFKQTSVHILDIGFDFVCTSDSFELGHFGLQLISDLIKFKWKDLDPSLKLDVKNKLMYLITNLSRKSIQSNLVEYPLYFKNTLCLTFLELIKREWPQNWPQLLNELAEVSRKSVDQKILVFIIYKFIVEEFISNENPNLPAQRRKDIIQYLNANMEYVYGFFLESLEESFCFINETNHVSIMSACLSCVCNYVDWINISFVFSRNYSLIKIIFSLLKHKQLCVEAAKCFISVLNRKGSLVERKPLSNLFNDELLTQIYCSITNSLQDVNFKELLKYLVQILISIGNQLNNLWVESDYKPPFDLNLFLNAIFELILNENRLFSYEAIQLWINLMTNQYLQTNATICQATLNLSQVMTNSKILFKINQDQYLDEFNSEEDFKKFLQKYRSDLSKLIKISTNLYLDQYLSAAYDWASKIFYETMNLNSNDLSGYDSQSFLYQCWDAMLFLWTSIMQTLNKKIKDKIAAFVRGGENDLELNIIKKHLINMISLCVKFNSTNANYCSFNFSLQSAVLIACELDNQEIILETILVKLFSDFTLFQAETSNNYQKYIQNLRKQIAANILNICRTYSVKLKRYYDEIYNKALSLINNSNSTQIERVIFIQSLIFCNNENDCGQQAQATFVDQFLRPINEFFMSPEFQASCQSLDKFIQFIGLNETNETNANTLQNRRQIFFYLNVLFAILKSVKETTPDTSQQQQHQKHYAFEAYMKLFEPLLQFLKCLNAMHSPEIKLKLNKDYLEMTEAAKTLVLMTSPSDTTSFNLTTTTTVNQETSYYTDKILMFFFNSYEELHQLIGLYFTKFKNELLLTNETGVEFVRHCGEALFSNFYDLPDFRIRFLVKYSLRSLLSFSFDKQKHIEHTLAIVSFNETFLEYFLPSILAKIDQRLKYFKSIKENLMIRALADEDKSNEQIENQIAEENQFILLCRDIVDLIRLFFNFNNTAFSKSESNQTDEFEIDNNNDHENLIDQQQQDIIGENLKSDNCIKLSELAVYLLKKNKTIYQSIILLLFEGLNLPDSISCLKLSQIAFTLFKVALVSDQTTTNFVNETQSSSPQSVVFIVNDVISEQIFKSCLNAITVHGEHHEISSLLLNLSYLMYEKFPISCQNVFNGILRKIPNLNKNLFDELLVANDKLKMSKNVKLNDKQRKETFKKIIQPIIGKNISQLYKNDIEIRILQPLNLKTNNKNLQINTEINICSLFDPNNQNS
jgi:exportin-5